MLATAGFAKAADMHDPANAVASLDVGAGLEATRFASEPMMFSPTNIDVDHRGRVWVCEVVNYRARSGSRKQGDRILILHDTSGDGRADRSTVFYQGVDINGCQGICVLGNRVIVSVSPNIFIFTDEDGDGKADRKEALFTKTGMQQHDHSTHAFVFGPDGKLVWNMGNRGQSVHDKHGNIVVDMAGHEVRANGRPYRQGLVFRCNMDGSQFEVLGHNFRNNYEVAVDSFGTLWQSDNDDDGNRGVRINYVMEFGNFGYTDQMTGAGWRTARTGMSPEVPVRHWHQNDPGVVPNLLQTGAGSPAGIAVYEGRLLPRVFHNQLVHSDAGPSVVRAYPAVHHGAGYRARIVNILSGKRNPWFRPADVCVAPDGSLLVADWYDAGVGGHLMADPGRGRIFRVAPPNTPYRVPSFDFDTPTGAAEALKSPNLEARYLAWTALHKLGRKAEPALLALYQDNNPRFRARALWLLSKISGRGQQHIGRAIRDHDADIRITALRAARQLNPDVANYIRQLAGDPAPRVRRECAIALRHVHSPSAAQLWVQLARAHDGQDRWYLEALGIAADGRWESFFDAWLAHDADRCNTAAGRDIIWRSRSSKTAKYLGKIIAGKSVPTRQLPRYFRALDFQQGADKGEVLARLAFRYQTDDEARELLILQEAVRRLDPFDVAKRPMYAQALDRVLGRTRGTLLFVQLVDKFEVHRQYGDLLALAQQYPDQQLGVAAIRVLLAKSQSKLIKHGLAQRDEKIAISTVRALGNSADGRAVALLLPLLADAKLFTPLRRQATRSLAKTRGGALRLIQMAKAKQLGQDLRAAAALPLITAPWKEVREPAAKLFPLPPAKDNKPLPPLTELLKMKGSAQRGRLVFEQTGTCAKCHTAQGKGKQVGPDLSGIGAKLSRQAFFESILYPSAGISHNYETYTLALEDGNVVTGIITSRGPDTISVKLADAIVRTFKKTEIEQMKRQPVSLMPADLQKAMTAQQLADVVQYMTTLKAVKP